MSSDSFSHRRGLALAVVLGVGVAGFHHAALARVSDDQPVAPVQVAGNGALPDYGTSKSGVIIVADKKKHRDHDDDNDNGHGKGNKSGRNGNDGDWNGNGNGNWSKSGHNGNGNGGNWNKSGNNGNWNGNGNYGNWNKGNKHWSNNNHWNNNWNKGWNNRAYVRGWSHRPYYGDFFGGVVLGSILAATGVGVVPYSPDPELCWYWADPYMYRGYWDYCD